MRDLLIGGILIASFFDPDCGKAGIPSLPRYHAHAKSISTELGGNFAAEREQEHCLDRQLSEERQHLGALHSILRDTWKGRAEPDGRPDPKFHQLR